VRQRSREAVRRGGAQGAPPASRSSRRRAHSSRKGAHVLSREGRRRASCPARCRRAGLNLSRTRRRSVSDLAGLRCIPGAGPHREHSSNVGGPGASTHPDRSRSAGITDHFARNTQQARKQPSIPRVDNGHTSGVERAGLARGYRKSMRGGDGRYISVGRGNCHPNRARFRR